MLSRRLDPRSGVSLVWGIVNAGAAANVIPDRGLVAGTVRILDAVAWADCESLVRELVHDIVRPYGVNAHVVYQQGVPPVVNEMVSHRIMSGAVHRALGEHGRVTAHQSLGGEDFGWLLDQVPGAMAPARDAHARRPDVRPAPGQSSRRRAGHRHRGTGPGQRRRGFFGHRPITTQEILSCACPGNGRPEV